MNIGLVRRGYSPTGGAENYLRRLAEAIVAGGNRATLLASPEWPRAQRPAGQDIRTVRGRSPRVFADQLAKVVAAAGCDTVFSLERVWSCDCYRAGDGVHRAWLTRRAAAEPGWQTWLRPWNPKHRQLLALEEALFAHGGAKKIIANSRLVRHEILNTYGSSGADHIEVVYNGLPAACFERAAEGERAAARARFELAPDDYAILFAGSGWERKGLACTLRTVARLPARLHARLLVAGRGDPRAYQKLASPAVRFLGASNAMRELYAAADVFVLPTIYDPFSNACLEALAAGLPVLTTTANGFAEIMLPGISGDVFAPDEAAGLAALLEAWHDPVRRGRDHETRISQAAEFTIEKNLAQTLNILTPGRV